MKIAFVVHDYHKSGGHSRYVAELATRFAQQHEVHVFANRIEAQGNQSVHFHRVPAERITSLSTVLTFALPATWMARGFDIVHAQGFCLWGANVITTHMCSRAWDIACRRLHGGLSLYHALFNKIAGYLEYSIYNTARKARVIAISQMVADDVRRHYACTLPTDVIYHGVDLDVFSPANRAAYRDPLRASFGFKKHHRVFLYVGDLRKGARQCISSLANLDDCHLLCVSRSSAEEYRAYAADLGVADRTHFAGPTDRIHTYYAAADAFVLPSPYDTFAMVALEAMASGLPVIVSRSVGAAELIDHNTNGFVVEDAANSAVLTQYMRQIAEDPDEACSIGIRARHTAEKHSWDAVARETMKVYQAVLAAQ